jgi:hypothetical protein
MKKAFVVLTHTHVPVTEGMHKGKFQVHEVVEFVDAVRNKHTSNATIIMDVINRKLVKNRARDSGATYELIEAHVVKGYGDKYKQFLEIVGVELPDILIEKKEESNDEHADDGRAEETAAVEKPKKKVAKKKKPSVSEEE